MKMIDQWIDFCFLVAKTPAEFYADSRKILRNKTLTFTTWDKSLNLEDIGFAQNKINTLTRHYINEEALSAAKKLWDERTSTKTYGSVGFHCYNHYVKVAAEKRTKLDTAVGPCLQAVILTQLLSKQTSIDIYYRSVEIFKKFPADVILLRDVILPQFSFAKSPVIEINFHFTNITAHPMYFVQHLPYHKDPVLMMEFVKTYDSFFYEWVVKWAARFLCDEYRSEGIMKYSQAKMIQKFVDDNYTSKQKKTLGEYMRVNHPGWDKRTNGPRIKKREVIIP